LRTDWHVRFWGFLCQGHQTPLITPLWKLNSPEHPTSMNCIFRDFTSWWPTKDPWQVPGSTYFVLLWFSSNMFKPNNQLWTPLISSGPNAATIWLPCLVRKPQGSWVIVIHIKRIVGWYGVTQKWPMYWGNDDQPWHFGVHQEKSDSISETPDLFQFVVPTKAATNKQHNSTRWWFSVLSWFPHQLYIYIYDKPYGISYTNAKFASSLNFKSLDFTTMPCLLPHQPGCLYIQSHLLWF
jgi:hypothetical protein